MIAPRPHFWNYKKRWILQQAFPEFSTSTPLLASFELLQWKEDKGRPWCQDKGVSQTSKHRSFVQVLQYLFQIIGACQPHYRENQLHRASTHPTKG